MLQLDLSMFNQAETADKLDINILKTALENIQTYVNKQPDFSNFKFFEIIEEKAVTDKEMKHNLGFTPKDVHILSMNPSTINLELPSDIGKILPFGALDAFVPEDCLPCDGSAVSRTTYANLFAKIGTTWGSGDGSTTFNVPDMRGATLRGIGTSTIFTQNATITLAQIIDDMMQGHKHIPIDQGSLFGLLGASGTARWVGGAGAHYTGKPSTDGTNGTPRTGLETTGKARGVNFIIVAKDTKKSTIEVVQSATFKPESFTSSKIVYSTKGACTIRVLIGSYSGGS